MSGTNSSLSINPAEQSQLLYDFVPISGVPTYVEHVDDQTMQSFYMYYTVPHPSGGGVTFPATTQPYDYQYVIVPITNLTVGATVYVTASFYDVPYPQPLTYIVQETGEDITKDYSEQITFVATETTHYLMLSAMGVHDEFTIFNVSASTADVSQGSCTPFLRTVKDGVTTDVDLDGQPYTVVGEVRTSCPASQAEPTCTCADEFQALQASVDEINGKIQTPTNYPINTIYSRKTGGYYVDPEYKHISVTFENNGTINGQYAPAGYSFTHDYMEQGYANAFELNGTSYLVWETR